MELCAEPESVLVNNNDVKHIHAEEREKNVDNEAEKKSKSEPKVIDAKRESTTDEESDLNCSIVQDQACSTQDSSIKITFKLQKKGKSEKKMSKNKIKSKINPEKVHKLIIKDTDGEYSIKGTDKEVRNDLTAAESSTKLQLDEQTTPDSFSEDGDVLLPLKENELEKEGCNQSQVLHDNSNSKLDSSEISHLRDNKKLPNSLVNNSTTCDDIQVTCLDSTNSKTKRKPVLNNSKELQSKHNEKTDDEDLNEEITLTKRRKVSEDGNENSGTEIPLLKTSDKASKYSSHKNSTHNLQILNKRELETSENEIEPKAKKLKIKSCESPEKGKVENLSNSDIIHSSAEDIRNENSLSQISIEIPENNTKSMSGCNENKKKVEEKSPTLKSPKDAKKITLEDFLKELNEESKNIKEGDEIPDSDDHEMSDDVGCVIVKEKDLPEQDDKKESTEECDFLDEHKSECNKKVVIMTDTINSNNDLTDAEKSSNTTAKTSSFDMGKSECNLSQEITNKADCKGIETEDHLREIHKEGDVSPGEDAKSEHSKVPTSDDEKCRSAKPNEKNIEKDQIQREDFDNKERKDDTTKSGELKSKENESKDDEKPYKKVNQELDCEEKTCAKMNENVKPESSKQEPKVSENINNKSSGDSDSSDASNSSDESSSSGSESSDSDSSSDSESGSDSSDSDSTDTEKKKEPEKVIVHPKKLKIRNAPSLSQDSVHKSDSSSSTQDSTEKSCKVENSNKPIVKTTETLSQQILAGSTGTTPVVVKKKRGRPRKYPLPDPTSEVTFKPEETVKPEVSVKTEAIIENEVTVKTEPCNDDTAVVNTEEEIIKVPKKRGRKPGFKAPRGRKPGRKKKIKKPRKHYEEYKQQKQQLALLKQEEEEQEARMLISTTPVPSDTPVVKRKRGRPKKIRDPEPSTYVPTDALSEQLLQLNSHLNKIVGDIPEICPGDDQNSNEITDNRLLEEINSGLDVITEEIVSEDVSNYLCHPLDEILQFPEPKKEIKVEDDDDHNAYNDYDNYKPFEHIKKKKGRPPKNPKKVERRLKTEDPNYHKKYYKYVKIPKDQQKKRGPKKRVDVDVKPEKIRRHKPGKIGRPRKRDLGAIERREERQDDSDHPYDESLSKELESVNRSMENILTEQDNDDKDFTVGHLKFEQLSEDQLKRSNRPKKSDVGMFSDFDNQIDELIEMAASEVQDRPKPKYRYYERIPKHLQKKRGRPRKIEDPDAPPRPPKPKKEKPPKPKKTTMVKKMVTDPETGEEVEIETEEVVEDNDNDYIDFDEEDEYDEDIDDEDKDKDFDIQDYLKKGKKGIDDRLEYEEVYPTKEKLFKPKKTLKNYRSLKAHHARFNRFGKFGNKIRSMMPARRNVNACDFRYVTVYDTDFNPLAKVQRMYCIKVAPATYDIADKYRPCVKVRNLDYEDVSEFFEKYWCDLCEISFLETKINKRRHEYIFHTEEIECDLCDRTVSNRYNLRKHREIFHQRKVYTCKVCGEEYRKFRSFQMHVWEAHPEVTGKNRAYFCNICQTVFYRRASFKFHYFEHLNGNIFAQFDTSLSDIEFLLKQLMY